MRMLLLGMMFALSFPAVAATPEGQSLPPARTANSDRMLIRFYSVSSSFRDPEQEPEPFPLVLEEVKEPARGGMKAAREFLESRGVAFPPGAMTVYLRSSSLLVVKNTAENLKLVDRIIELDTDIQTIKCVAVEARLVEFSAEVEDWLARNATFAELHRELGERVRTLATASLVTKSGNRAVAETGSDQKNALSERGTLEVEPSIGPDGHTVKLHYRYIYQPPGSSGAWPAICDFEGEADVVDGGIAVAKTFTRADRGNPKTPRHFAVLLRVELLDAAGKPLVEKQAENKK